MEPSDYAREKDYLHSSFEFVFVFVFVFVFAFVFVFVFICICEFPFCAGNYSHVLLTSSHVSGMSSMEMMLDTKSAVPGIFSSTHLLEEVPLVLRQWNLPQLQPWSHGCRAGERFCTSLGTSRQKKGWPGNRKSSSPAHSELEPSLPPQVGDCRDFMTEVRLQPSPPRGNDPSTGGCTRPCRSLTQYRISQAEGASLAQLPVGTLLLTTPVLLPITNTGLTHFSGKRPREQTLYLRSEEGCQMGSQPIWEAAAAAADQAVSSGGLQAHTVDMSIWGEIPTFALKLQRQLTPYPLV